MERLGIEIRAVGPLHRSEGGVEFNGVEHLQILKWRKYLAFQDWAKVNLLLTPVCESEFRRVRPDRPSLDKTLLRPRKPAANAFDRIQTETATARLAGDRLRSLIATPRVARTICGRVLPHALDHLRLPRRDVEKYQCWSVRRSAICFPRLDQLGAHIQISREHGLRRVQRCPHALHRAAVQRLRRQRKRRRAQAPLALCMSERFVRGREEFGERFVLHGIHSFGESVALICATISRSFFFWSAVNVLASLLL